MKKYIKQASLALAAALALSLAACGGSAQNGSVSSAPAETSGGASSGGGTDLVTVKIGATPAPHQEILEALAPEFEKAGVKVEVVPFTDYTIPNKVLEGGDIDGNYFQHQPYLDDYNAKTGGDLISAVNVHYEPMGLYPGKTASLEDLPDGGVIAVPNDGSNEARALMLLQNLGLIKLKDDVKIDASNALNVSITALDIAENPKNLDIQEVAAEQIPRLLPDVDFGVINGNYALSAGITDTIQEQETDDIAKLYINVLAVRNGDESRPEIQKVCQVLTSDACKKFIEEKYKGTVIPAF